MSRYKNSPNSFGIPSHEWDRMTSREKARLREQRYRDKLRQDPEAYTERRRREYARQAEYRAENRDIRNAKHADYKKRNAARLGEYNKLYRRKLTSEDRIRVNPDRVYQQIVALLPRGLPPHIRDDVAGTVCLQVLERQVPHDKMADAVRNALRAHNRMFDHFKTVSLDAPVPGTDGMTMRDRIVAPSTFSETCDAD